MPAEVWELFSAKGCTSSTAILAHIASSCESCVGLVDANAQEFLNNEATFETEEFSAQDLQDVQDLCDLAATENEMRELCDGGKRRPASKLTSFSGGSSTTAPSSSATLGEKDSDSGASPPSEFKDRTRAVLKARERWDDQVNELEIRGQGLAESLQKDLDSVTAEIKGQEYAKQLELYIEIVGIRKQFLKGILEGTKEKALACMNMPTKDSAKMPKANDLLTLAGLRSWSVAFEEAKTADDLKAKQSSAAKVMTTMKAALKDIQNASTDLRVAKAQKKQKLEKQKAKAEKMQAAADARDKKRKAAEEDAKDAKKKKDGGSAEKAPGPGSIFENCVSVKKVKTVDWKDHGVSWGPGPGL